MQVLNNRHGIAFDVDKTLVFDPADEMISLSALVTMGVKYIKVTDPYDGETKIRVIHEKHIKLLKDHKARGYSVTVWSHNGELWAEAVVRALGLEDVVDYAAAKFDKCCDDLPPSEILGTHIYIKDCAWLNLTAKN